MPDPIHDPIYAAVLAGLNHNPASPLSNAQAAENLAAAIAAGVRAAVPRFSLAEVAQIQSPFGPCFIVTPFTVGGSIV